MVSAAVRVRGGRVRVPVPVRVAVGSRVVRAVGRSTQVQTTPVDAPKLGRQAWPFSQPGSHASPGMEVGLSTQIQTMPVASLFSRSGTQSCPSSHPRAHRAGSGVRVGGRSALTQSRSVSKHGSPLASVALRCVAVPVRGGRVVSACGPISPVPSTQRPGTGSPSQPLRAAT